MRMKTQLSSILIHSELPLVTVFAIFIIASGQFTTAVKDRTVEKISHNLSWGGNNNPVEILKPPSSSLNIQQKLTCTSGSSSCRDKTKKRINKKSQKYQPFSFSALNPETTPANNGKSVPNNKRSRVNKFSLHNKNKTNVTISHLGPELTALASSVKNQKKKCKTINNEGFKCQRLKWYLWMINNYDINSTSLTPWMQLIRNEDFVADNITLRMNDLLPDNWPEETIFKFLKKWGDPIDEFAFHKFKEFTKSRELKFSLPKLIEIKVAPRAHAVVETGRSTPRIFWDPGFNLKLKLPFFKDELKVAISTGPSFLAGIGTGIVLLIVKSLFAPFLLGMKYMIYNIFWKDGSPYDLMKMVWGGSGWGPEPWESQAPPAAIEHYEPPNVHNHFDNLREPPPHGGNEGGGSGYGFGYNGYDQKLQYSQLNPILQGLTGSSNGYKSSLEEGRRQHFKSLLGASVLDDASGGGGYGITGGGLGISESQDNIVKHSNDGINYIPSTALQAEVENYDPFYSPLLSRIDSIFTHLGYHEEGCRERAVCSIYKFPVKYAPYSNLLSAQLSKHQSELKRPVTKSPKILRYFKYMKAAKDGQGQASCTEIYPSCDQDTDSVSNLPMITTFNQLSDLMGAEAVGPSGS